jgi:hypothetical protein
MLRPMKKDITKAMTQAEQLIAAVQQSGFPHLDSLIDLFVGGSELHGAKVKTRTIWTSTACIWNRPNSYWAGQAGLPCLEHGRQNANLSHSGPSSMQ